MAKQLIWEANELKGAEQMRRIRVLGICVLVGLFLVLSLPTSAISQPPYFGKYRGTVVNITDPMGLGRIKAAVPDVFGAGTSSWALPAFPFAGLNHGLILLPELGDNVWIEFEAGDPNYPIWTGGWFSGGSVPGSNLGSRRMLKTSKGHEILIDEASDRLELVHASGPEIIISNTEITLKVGNTVLAVKSDGVYINNKLLNLTRLYLPLLTHE